MLGDRYTDFIQHIPAGDSSVSVHVEQKAARPFLANLAKEEGYDIMTRNLEEGH